MTRILSLFLLLVTLSNNAQKIQWQNTIGGNDEDWSDFIELTKDGNYISGGHSYSNISADKDENSRGQNDFWFFKIDDGTGNLLWQKTIGGNGNDHLVSAKETSDGGFILGGYSSSGISGEKSQNSRGGDDYWVVKLDANRNIIWDKTYGGTDTDRLTTIIETEDGGYLIGGESYSNISGDKSENSKGSVDIWLIKIDNQGSIVWQKTIGGNGSDSVASIIKTTDHHYILAGSSNSNISGDKTQVSKGFADYWILKIDLNGLIIWQSTIGGDNVDNAKVVVQATDGNYIVGGDSGSLISGDKTENTIGRSIDVWLVKLNPNGQLIWQKNIGDNDYDALANMRVTSDGGLVIGITSDSYFSKIKTEPKRGDLDYWIVKLDANYKIEWDKLFGGNSTDKMQSIVQANDGSYVVIGNSLSNISADKTENNSGLQDIWAIKFNYCNQSILPKVNSPQTFCLEQNARINDIVVTGQNIKWYDTEKAGTLLSKTTTLQDNTTYYASQNSDGCESERVAVLIKIQNTNTPTSEENQTFCSNQNTTLSNVAITGTAIKWYDAATNGNLLPNSTLVRNSITYYATQTIANCESKRTPITIEIQESESIDCFNSIDELPFPKFFTPNNDGYNDYWTINFAYLKPNSGINIFDRYGKLITTLNQNESWNGTYNGQLLPSTDYWFVVTRADGKEYKGHFSMKR